MQSAPGTLYHHFADKRALLLELVDCFGERLAAQRACSRRWPS
jgi:AcrR family transcriptional regulator